MLSDHNKFLETAFFILNRVYFDDSLPEVVITIQSSKSTYAHITTGEIWKDNWGKYREINLSAEYLNRTTPEVISSLMHEMTHLYAMENNIKETSNNNRYHNKKFKELAEQRDLKISYAPVIGWSVTEPTERLIETIKQYHLDTQMEYVRMGAYQFTGGNDNNGSGSGSDDNNGKPPKKKSSTRKYICSVCHNSVRATKDVNIACLDCNVQMVKEE